MTASIDADPGKESAARAAALLVESGMTVGLGTGSTVAHLLPALAERQLDIVCVATSPGTANAARPLGLRVEDFDKISRIDLTIDGADQVDPKSWLVKGGGGAHTREKIVAAATDRFVVIVSSEKVVDRIAAPIPLELLEFGLAATIAHLGDVRLRDVPRSPDNGLIADYYGAIDDPAAAAALLAGVPGVVGHGLFSPDMVSDVIIGSSDGVEHRAGPHMRAGG